ncbi:hypothetical protein [Kordia jejudonensis]|uniref:hypothetical protein n=1 Tax=Kordia jejudonensis TaxID=1348245 RepID=UPI00062924FC|nr:hypothetical protein [Kordia jejudonensis]
MVLIENRYGFKDEIALLKALGKANYEFDSEVSFEACLYPADESINIGFYNNTIIICDDYQITEQTLATESLNLSPAENALVALFPQAEILSVSCHSVSNFHAYALIQRGLKTRIKIAGDGEVAVSLGEPFAEEKEIYARSYEVDGIHYWKDENHPDDPYTEDSLLEDFTFGVAKRLLGVNLDTDEGFELTQNITFKKYKNPNPTPKETPNYSMRTLEEELSYQKRAKWIKYALYAVIFIVILYVRSCMTNNSIS